MGGQLAANVSREALVLEASFLRDDLPYFAELLAEVVSSTKYTSKPSANESLPTGANQAQLTSSTCVEA